MSSRSRAIALERLLSLVLSGRFAERFKRCTHFGDEGRRLLPGGEVGANGELVIVDELHIRFL